MRQAPRPRPGSSRLRVSSSPPSSTPSDSRRSRSGAGTASKTAATVAPAVAEGSRSTRPPSTRRSAATHIDLPAPVSPVSAVSPGPGSQRTPASTASPLTRSSSRAISRPPMQRPHRGPRNDNQGADPRIDRRASGAERVGGRTGGGGDDHPVGVELPQQLALDLDPDAREVEPVGFHHHLVEGQGLEAAIVGPLPRPA